MGGLGSGNFRPRKRTVESCFMVDIIPLVRMQVVQAGVRREGTLCWPTSASGAHRTGLEYVVDTREGQWMRLHYRYQAQDGAPAEEVEYWLQFVTTPQHYGGMRWWFRCPLVVDGEACARRVRKLYLPPGEKYFGCKRCHQLTYESRRDQWATSVRGWPAVTVQYTDVSEKRVLSAVKRSMEERRQESAKKAERTT